MSNSDPSDNLARSEGRAAFEQVLREAEIRRLAYGRAARRRARPLLGLLAWTTAGAAALAAVAAGALELIG